MGTCQYIGQPTSDLNVMVDLREDLTLEVAESRMRPA